MPTLTDNLRDCPTRRLGDVATVRLGFTPLKEKRSDYASASTTNQRPSQPFVRRTVLMVQPSNITDEGTIDWRRLERINVQPKQSYESHMLQPGSVLLCLRGVMRVANLTEQTLQHDLDATAEPLPIVASGAWAVIRPDTQVLTTNYLTWHLKQPSTVARLHEERAGSALQFIPLSVVQDMTLPLPRCDAQDALVRAADLIDQVAKLERQRLELLRSYLAGSIQTHSPAGRVARAGETKNRGNSAS
jgi:hypothetical protein